MDRIGVAIIGCGFSATVFHAPFLLNSDRFVIRCVVTSKQECEVKRLLGIEVPCFSSLDEALRSKIHQFSLVVVTSPNNSHFSFAMQCLQNRLWVVVEKPLTTTLQEAEMLCSAANSERLACFQNRKFDSDFLTVKREIDSGVLGRVVHLRSEWRRYRPEVKPGWRWSCAGPGTGLLFDLGPHMVHQAMLLFKAMPSTVSCIMALQRDGAVVDDFFAVTLQFANEPALVVQMEASYLNCSSEFGERSWLVYGEKGCFEKRMGIDAQGLKMCYFSFLHRILTITKKNSNSKMVCVLEALSLGLSCHAIRG